MLHKKRLKLKREIDRYRTDKRYKRKGHLIYKYNETLALINRFGEK
ncbi:MAG: hypothetical protein ACRC30_08315 [Clostridium sp.]